MDIGSNLFATTSVLGPDASDPSSWDFPAAPAELRVPDCSDSEARPTGVDGTFRTLAEDLANDKDSLARLGLWSSLGGGVAAAVPVLPIKLAGFGLMGVGAWATGQSLGVESALEDLTEAGPSGMNATLAEKLEHRMDLTGNLAALSGAAAVSAPPLLGQLAVSTVSHWPLHLMAPAGFGFLGLASGLIGATVGVWSAAKKLESNATDGGGGPAQAAPFPAPTVVPQGKVAPEPASLLRPGPDFTALR